jgi:hypothetical protein
MKKLTVGELKKSIKACEKEIADLTVGQSGKSISKQMVQKADISVSKIIGLYGAIVNLGNEVIGLRKQPNFTEEELKTLETELEVWADNNAKLDIIYNKVYAANHY